MTGVPGFGARLARTFEVSGRLCVGIDPHDFLLESWGLPVSAAGARDFGLRVVEATAGAAGIVKPQVAFFERFGSAGYAALESVVTEARAAGLLVIADAKRGDIGTSVEAYGRAWLEPGSPLEADAMTVVAYQGLGSLDAVISLARANGKGVFVLAATSNPEAAVVQRSVVGEGPRRGSTIASALLEDIRDGNAAADADSIGSVGVVLGATLDLASFGIDVSETASGPAVPVLAPGFGSQGAALEDAPRLFGALVPATIVSESRSVLGAGPSGIRDAIIRRTSEVRDTLDH